MKRVLGLTQLTVYGVGMIVGAGIYSVIGKAAGVAGDTLCVSFIIAAIAAVLTALSYAELASMFPRAGAEYIYLKNIFPNLPALSFVCGSMMIFAGACTAATVASAFSGYLQEVFQLSFFGTSVLVVLGFCLLNIWGIKEASWFNAFFTLLEVTGLIIFIYFGLTMPQYSGNISAKIELKTISGAAMIIFAYFGFENLVNFAEETKEPQRKIPQAIFLSLFISATLYLLVSFSALQLATPADLASTDGPLSAALLRDHREAALIIGVIAIFSTANTILISILSTSRIVFSMAREGDLPAVFSRLTRRRETPWAASIGIFIITAMLLPAGGIGLLASTSSFATMIAFILINLALIHLRFTRPDIPRKFRTPGSVGLLPLTPFAAILISTALLFFFEKEVYILGLSFLALMLVLYFLRKRFHKRTFVF